MEGYLGEFPIDKIVSKEEAAMDFISAYSFIDGAHHKQWLIDQVARILLGTPVIYTEARWSNGETEERFRTGDPSKEYLDWLDDDADDYDIVGIAP